MTIPKNSWRPYGSSHVVTFGQFSLPEPSRWKIFEIPKKIFSFFISFKGAWKEEAQLVYTCTEDSCQASHIRYTTNMYLVWASQLNYYFIVLHDHFIQRLKKYWIKFSQSFNWWLFGSVCFFVCWWRPRDGFLPVTWNKAK